MIRSPLIMLPLDSVLFGQTDKAFIPFVNRSCPIALQRAKQRAKSSSPHMEPRHLKSSPMFGDLSLCSDQVSGQNKKSFSTFVSGMKESHLSFWSQWKTSSDTVHQTFIPESAFRVAIIRFLQQFFCHCDLFELHS